MKYVETSEAKTYWSDLLERVSRSEKITITKHGVPIALLIPVAEAAPKLTHQEVIEGMCALRERVKHRKMRVRDMVSEGR